MAPTHTWHFSKMVRNVHVRPTVHAFFKNMSIQHHVVELEDVSEVVTRGVKLGSVVSGTATVGPVV